MILEIANPEGGFSRSEIESREELFDFLETLSGRKPFYCELRQESYKLSICIRGELGSVQHSPANGSPPYMMAVTPERHNPNEEVEFVIGNEATPLSARHALPLSIVKQIVVRFFETEDRSKAVLWEEI
jgi:hypothetical protein